MCSPHPDAESIFSRSNLQRGKWNSLCLIRSYSCRRLIWRSRSTSVCTRIMMSSVACLPWIDREKRHWSTQSKTMMLRVMKKWPRTVSRLHSKTCSSSRTTSIKTSLIASDRNSEHSRSGLPTSADDCPPHKRQHQHRHKGKITTGLDRTWSTKRLERISNTECFKLV